MATLVRHTPSTRSAQHPPRKALRHALSAPLCSSVLFPGFRCGSAGYRWAGSAGGAIVIGFTRVLNRRWPGQRMQAVILTLTATELTPAHMPEQIEIAAYACVDEEMCRRVAAGWCVHREAVERLQ